MRSAAEYSCGANGIACSANVAGRPRGRTLPGGRSGPSGWSPACRRRAQSEASRRRNRSKRSTSCVRSSSVRSLSAAASKAARRPAAAAWTRRPSGVRWAVTTRPSVAERLANGEPGASIRCIVRVIVDGSTRSGGPARTSAARRAPTSRSSRSSWAGSTASGSPGPTDHDLDGRFGAAPAAELPPRPVSRAISSSGASCGSAGTPVATSSWVPGPIAPHGTARVRNSRSRRAVSSCS